MEGIEIRKKLACLIMVVVLIIPLTVYPNLVISQPDTNHLSIDAKLSQNTSIGPITIVNDAGFENEGFSGSGTQVDPYLIENFDVNTTGTGISIMNTRSFFVIRNCQIISGDIGISIFNVSNGVFDECKIQALSAGMFASDCTSILIDNCEVFLSEYGFEGSALHSITIRDSSFHHNDYGLYLAISNNTRVEGCTFYTNLRGILFQSDTYNITVFSCILGWNGPIVGGFVQGQENARDNSQNNTWTANRWSDYDGEGAYVIPGGRGSQDLFASLMVDISIPVVEGLDDIRYDEGEIGNWLNWNATDPLPAFLSVYIDDNLFETREWITDNYRLPVDGFQLGSHNVTILYIDAAGNTLSDTVWVVVIISVFGGEGTEYVLYASVASILCVAGLLIVIKRLR
ncbi:MAG: right-handed parallel beta-helix repeat-containing protein [Candidatus Thorarchaeota archaeon]